MRTLALAKHYPWRKDGTGPLSAYLNPPRHQDVGSHQKERKGWVGACAVANRLPNAALKTQSYFMVACVSTCVDKRYKNDVMNFKTFPMKYL